MERVIPVGAVQGRGVGASSMALAVALAAGAMMMTATTPLRAADPPAKAAAPAAATPTPEQVQQQEQDKRAAATLNEAKQAYEQKNYGPSVAKYREFLGNFPKRPEAMAAHYGLGMALAETPDNKDWNAIIAELTPVVASADVPDKGRAHYWLGVALRVTGEQQIEATRNHPEQKEQIAKALERIGQSGAQFVAADAALVASVKDKPAADAKELPPAMEMAAIAKVAGAEALAKTGKPKEAVELVKVFASDPIWMKSKQAPAGLLALGQSDVTIGDYPAAFTALAQLAPFDQLAIGLQARYLLARVLQETGERPEAVVQYDAVGKAYLDQRRKAEETLRNREAMRGKPFDQMRLESLTRSVPDYVSSANYNAATIQFEYGQWAEALPRFTGFVQASPKSDLAPLAQLRMGICQVSLKQADGMRTLQPLFEHPALGDQAVWYAGRLQRALADPANADAARKSIEGSIATFKKAAEKSSVLAKTDLAAASRRGDILLDKADAHSAIKQYKEAAVILEGLANDASNPARAEVAHERWAMALDRDGQFAASDAACASFTQKYAKSMLRPSVMFWQAENAYRQGVELGKKPESAAQAKVQQEKAAVAYLAVVEKYPEFAQASAARFGLGMSFYRRGEWAKAGKQLERVLDADRVGDLAAASYYQADCLFHQMPENADDALSAARLSGQLEEAAKLLSGFVGGTEDRPEMPDAMLKLADCYQRNAAILADQQEKVKALTSARETYDKLLAKYPKHPAFAAAVMDRARCIGAAGDVGGAINELNRFRNDGQLAKSDVAPLALVRLADLMIHNGRAVDAAAMLDKARKDYEAGLANDPARAPWIASLRYQHGMAMKESGKPKEALAIFEGVIKEFATRPEAAEASLASIQVRKDEAMGKLKAARQAVAGVPADKPVDPKLLAAQTDAIKQVGEIATAFSEHADRLADTAGGSDLHVRTLRDAANSWRAIADAEIDAARRAKAEESLAKLKEKLAKDPPVGKSNSIPRPPQVRLASVPVQPAEQKAREYFNKALEAGPDAPVCNDMRLELAQMHFDRGEADQAIQLLTAAIDKNPPPELQNQLRLKLGNALLLKKDGPAAEGQALLVLNDSASPLRAAAYLVKGKALVLQKNWGDAITVLTRYRTGAEKYVNAGPVTEEGLVRLAEAYAAAGNWEESRTTYEHLIGRFGGSKWATEARFGIGLALQHAKQFDRAVEAYADVTRRTSSEIAARAQMQIGLCRAEQKRWQDAVNELLIVPGTYDYAEWAASASIEAGKALVELKQPAQAKDILQRVVRDHPGTEWAQLAQKRLAEIKI